MFKLIAVTVLITTFMFQTTRCSAQTTPSKSLLALSKTDHTLSIVDPVTLKILSRIPVGEDPHELVASSDGKTAYVAIYGGGSLHELNVIDLVAQKPSINIDTRPLFGPHDVAFVNNKVWFTAEGSKAVGRYDPATSKLDWSMGTGQDRTHMLYVTADGKKIYTTNVSSGTVSILVDSMMPPGNFTPPKDAPKGNMPPPPPGGGRPRSNWVQIIIPTARGSEGFDVSPDGKELWTASSEYGTITIIDLNSKKLDTKIDAKVTGANRLKFTPDGKMVFISSLQSGEITVYDAKRRKEIKRLKLGRGAAGILMDADGSRAFVACSADDYVAIVNLKTLEVTGKLDVGGNPDGLAWAVRQ